MKRFTETTVWQEKWHIRLRPELRLLWYYLWNACDHAGVWDSAMEMAEFFVGLPLPPEEEILAAYGGRVRKLANGKWFIVDFIAFQQGTRTLSQANAAHRNILRSLEANEIPDYRAPAPGPAGASKEPPGSPGNSKSTSNSKSPERMPEGESAAEARAADPARESAAAEDGSAGGEAAPAGREEEEFEAFWTAYPRKEARRRARQAWRQRRPDLQRCLRALAAQRSAPRWREENGRYIPLPANWLEDGRWDDLPTRAAPPAREPAPPDPREGIDPEAFEQWAAQAGFYETPTMEAATAYHFEKFRASAAYRPRNATPAVPAQLAENPTLARLFP